MTNLSVSANFSPVPRTAEWQSTFLKWGLKPLALSRLIVIYATHGESNPVRVAHIVLRVGDERIHIASIGLSLFSAKHPRKAEILWDNREMLQTRIDRVFCERQPAATRIVRNS